ncbi:nucleotidyltransferase family protein [Mucilaginibacter panaciglaebae]|uniref:MobA-like NTP transferase domain-containing protein n=1 Tax=Mucilaginibacter panaciglaebae TaxID=502331 RepID=A0ABP7WE93_9SPHI
MTALLILAAGASNRLGFPKQTLLYKGKTLIEHAIEVGLKSKCQSVTIVLGANVDSIETGIKHYPVNIIQNNNWADGMASSIKAGIEVLKENPDTENVVIMLCDQPFVNRALIDSMLYKQQETGKKIVACAYNDTLGVPVLFNKSFFTELLMLQGKEGAKKIINNHPDDVVAVSFEKGAIDIDTLNDYQALLKKS